MLESFLQKVHSVITMKPLCPLQLHWSRTQRGALCRWLQAARCFPTSGLLTSSSLLVLFFFFLKKISPKYHIANL